MKSRIHRIIAAGLVMTAITFAQQNQILPSQTNAIKSLAVSQGFTEKELDAYVLQTRGTSLGRLTRQQGVALIQSFQSSSPPRLLPQPPPVAARLPSRPRPERPHPLHQPNRRNPSSPPSLRWACPSAFTLSLALTAGFLNGLPAIGPGRSNPIVVRHA